MWVLLLLLLLPFCCAKTFYGSNDTGGGVNLNCLLLLIRPGAHAKHTQRRQTRTTARQMQIYVQLYVVVSVCELHVLQQHLTLESRW